MGRSVFEQVAVFSSTARFLSAAKWWLSLAHFLLAVRVMARIPLIHIPGGLYSVVSKCNNAEFLFDAAEKFEMYIRHLIRCKAKLGFTIYDIVCMSNHVHELYRVPDDVTIAQILQAVKGGFAQQFNPRYGRTGHFWKNKPFYRIVEDEAYAFCSMNYFHMNPVRAHLVEHPEQWPYSGYRFHVLGEQTGLLGLLLDHLPGVTPDWNHPNRKSAVAKCVNSKIRYIGSARFRYRMRFRGGSPRKASDAFGGG